MSQIQEADRDQIIRALHTDSLNGGLMEKGYVQVPLTWRGLLLMVRWLLTEPSVASRKWQERQIERGKKSQSLLDRLLGRPDPNNPPQQETK